MNNDSYSFVGLAHIAFQQAMKLGESPSEQDRLLVKAYNKYLDILAHDHSNAYASLGLANVLAFFGKTEDASEIYRLITESTSSLFEPLVNQAHLLVEEKKFDQSINLYQNVLEKFKPGDLKMQMYLSKALYLKEDYAKCKELLTGLILRFPH